MQWIRRIYDRRARTATLNLPIFFILVCAFFSFLGLNQIKICIRTSDHDLLSIGEVFLAIGVLGVIHSVLLIHAVVRRLVVEARPTP
jgi:hypothetical protein